MEGKEVRFGIFNSALFATITTDASCGAVNSMHDSFTPLGGLVPLLNIQLGEVVFGGVGAGLYGMLIYVVIAVFIAGLMVGRTPEYLGKKIEPYDMKMASFVILVLAFSILGFSAWASVSKMGLPDATGALTDGTNNNGPHGFSEILYAYSSCTGNNGSAFAGLTGECALVQHHARPRDALRTVCDDRADPRARRFAWPQETRGGKRRHLPGLRPALHQPGRRNRPPCRRAHLRARARAGPGRRTLPHVCRQAVLAAISIHHPLLLPSQYMAAKTHSIFDPAIIVPAIGESFKKLDPRHMVGNPVMFVTEVGAVITTVLLFTGGQGASFGFLLQITLWLWFTVLFANFAEAMAEGRGKAQADTLRKARTETKANRLKSDGKLEEIPSSKLHKDDVVVVKAGEFIPGDGEVIEGAATVDESAITGESAPVVRESGGDRSAVTGGTRVLSDVIKIRITANPGETFLDRMIGLVEGAKRQKTPNEIALTILLSALTIIFLIVLMSMKAFGIYQSVDFSITVLVALLVCLIPTTIGGLLSAIGIAGIDRLVQKNVLAMSGRAVEAAGDVDVLLLDKTGTITLGNRQATEFFPAPGVTKEAMAEAAQLSSLADETPEGPEHRRAGEG